MLTTVLVLLLSPISTCDVSAPVSPVAAIEEFLATAPGYPEEAGVYENGVRNGNFVYFGPDGTIKKTERWENGVLVEQRLYRGGRIDAIERWNAEGRRTENVLYNRGGYSKIVEHFAPGGHISWHEKWSRYTGDRITQVGPFNWQ